MKDNLIVYLKGVLRTRAWEYKFNLRYRHLDHTYICTLNLRESDCDVVYCRSDAGQIKASAGDRRQTTRCISDKDASLAVSIVNIPRALANIQWAGGFRSPLIWVWINSFLSVFLLAVILGRYHVFFGTDLLTHLNMRLQNCWSLTRQLFWPIMPLPCSHILMKYPLRFL